jgi:3-methyladenine DNA glycosylase AlkD
MANLIDIKKEILKAADPSKAKLLQGFFKTGQGEYGEGDIFLGITVPEQRKIARKYKDLGLKEIQELLNSKFHEHRLIALLILIEKYDKTDDKKEIVDFYLKNTMNINNWDLVDLSSHKILGDYLLDKDRSILFKLARSEDLWEKRISIISTFAFINKNQSEDSFKIAEILLNDKHDLIHKAVGWMLREVGKRVSQDAEEEFLKKHYKNMPRTMLRYAIERFDEDKRQFYLNG